MSCLYIKNKLIKAINEEYFRYHQKTNMEKLDNSAFWITLEHNMDFARRLPDNNLHNMLTDLSNVVLFNDGKFVSELAKELHQTITQQSKQVGCFHPIVDILKSVSKNVYMVGGAVRDDLLGKATKDYDFVCDLPYDNLKVILEDKGYTVKEEGQEFLVLIATDGIEQFEIANFRKDGTYEDGRRPTSVSIGTMKDDSERRDFTCNSLYWNLHTQLIEDPTGFGIDDCMNRILRFNGKAEDRLKEDALRGWRAFRLCATKGLEMERKTEKAVRGNFDLIYKNSNPARVLQEMIKF